MRAGDAESAVVNLAVLRSTAPAAECFKAVRRAVAIATLLGAPLAHDAAALCTAAQVIATVAGCPNSSAPCVINQPISIDSGACVLDFGDRDVVLTRRMTVGSNAVTLRARSLEISRVGSQVSGDIFAQGSGTTSPSSIGGTVIIQTTGEVRTLGSGPTFLMAGNSRGGFLRIDAGGNVSLQNNVNVSNLNNRATAAGGSVEIRSANDITIASGVLVDASGGNNSSGGGEVNLVARGNISSLGTINVSGFDGGTVTVSAGLAATVRAIQAIGNGDAGSGGCLAIDSGSGTTIDGAITARGTAGTFQTGGCGGVLCLDSAFGDVRITPSGSITATGATPDGGGGLVAVFAGRNFEALGAIDIRGPNGPSCGGEICVSAEVDITTSIGAPITARGGDGGGGIDLGAGRHVRVFGTVDASASRQGGSAGLISLEAGLRGSGNGELMISGLVDARAQNGCSLIDGCGDGGTIDVAGADVAITASGAIDTSGAFAGDNTVTARRALTIAGAMRSVGAQPDGTGLNDILRIGGQPVSLTGTINPPAVIMVRDACTGQPGDNIDCIIPSPICGDGSVQFPELCDPGPNPSTNTCGTCSLFCELLPPSCNDGLICTVDSCDPLVGCINLPIPGSCAEPTPTPTITPTPTQTRTPTQTATPTVTRTPTITATPSQTPTATNSPSVTATSPPTDTPTESPTPTATNTATTAPTQSPTAPHTATAQPTHTPASTATATAAALPSETPTAIDRRCPGDCNGDGMVGVNELITAVNINLGNRPVTDCPAADLNGNGQVAINELVSAVLSALDGC